MSENKKTIQVTVAPHLQGEEVQKRLAAAVERRNTADYECFQLLRDMADNGLLGRGGFLALLKNDESMSEEEKLDTANHYESEVLSKLRERREADMQIAMAMRGQQ
jgi:hypothetical protein